MQFAALLGRWQGLYWYDGHVGRSGVPFQLILREAVPQNKHRAAAVASNMLANAA
jgi:hypothetical protein